MLIRRFLLAGCLLAAPGVFLAQAQRANANAATAAQPITDKDVAATQQQLIELLRLSPTLTTVVARDPSLLADTEYINRTNPQLAQFLAAHPEVTRNPDYYLFTHLPTEDGRRRDEALERAVWPEMQRVEVPRSGFDNLLSNMPPLIGVGLALGTLFLGLRMFLENRRWSRIFKLQSDVHGRIIDKCSSSQELAAYMETEAGRRFLEAAPIPINAAPEQRMPNAVARVLTPLQVGVVMVLLGAGVLMLRNIDRLNHVQMTVLGVVILMPGIGFILSAGITWLLAGHLGLMPSRSDRYDSPHAELDRK